VFRLVDPDPDMTAFSAEVYVSGEDGVVFSAAYGSFDEDAVSEAVDDWCSEFFAAADPGKTYDPSRDFPRSLTFLAFTEDDGREYCEIEVPVLVLVSGYFENGYGGTNDPAVSVLYTFVADAWTQTVFEGDPGSGPGQWSSSPAFNDAYAAALVSAYGPPEDRLTVDCVPVSRTSSAAAASTLALMCEPGSVPPGALVTCTVSGGDPSIDILWRASGSPVFASAGVTLDVDGSGTFSFRVPSSMAPGPVLVELVEWGRTATVTVTGPVLPARIPAGEGAPVRGALLGFALLGVAGLLVRRMDLAR
jgi:hypothetical protein